MGQVDKLEYYLLSLERVLSPLAADRRASIILEVRQKIQESMASGLSIDQAISAMGRVEQVAFRYGVQYVPKRSLTGQIVKLFVLFMLISILITAVAGWYLWKDLKSVMHFDINQDENHFTIGGQVIPFGIEDAIEEEFIIEKTFNIDPKEFKKLEFRLSNGKIRFSNSFDNKVSLKCKLKGTNGADRVTEAKETVVVNFADALGGKCDVTLPKGADIVASLANGDLRLQEIQNNADIKIGNGRLQLDLKTGTDYKYELHLGNGRQDEFVSSQNQSAYLIRGEVTNGQIERVEEE